MVRIQRLTAYGRCRERSGDAATWAFKQECIRYVRILTNWLFTPLTCSNSLQRLWLGPSGVHGWGGFVKEPIKKHHFIHEYVGEVHISNALAVFSARCGGCNSKTLDADWDWITSDDLAAGSRATWPSVRCTGASVVLARQFCVRPIRH